MMLNQPYSPFSHKFIFCCLLLLISMSSSGIEMKGVEILDELPHKAGEKTLKLNGASVRTAYVFADVYIGALYLEEKLSTPDDIFENNGAKAMYFYMLRDVRGRSIANALKEAMQVNLTKEEMLSFANEFKMLKKFLGKQMRIGEVGKVEYLPNLGSRIVLGDEVKGVIAGKAFFNALLSAWIGNEPVSRKMKAELLGLKYERPISPVKKLHRDD